MSRSDVINLSTLADFPLPPLEAVDDKEGRGRVLVVAGGARVPGAALLTGLAALRAGAGKLQLAAPEASALHIGLAAPEAAVLPVPVTAAGEFAAEAAEALKDSACEAHAIVIGPGMLDREAAGAIAQGLIAVSPDARFVLDAAAMTGADFTTDTLKRRAGHLVLTPHAGEMAKLLGVEKAEVEGDPLTAGRRLAREAGAVVAMKGASTWIVTPDGRAWRHDDGVVGLATSGSGDVLAGLIGGFLARGASPLVATLWGVCVHGGAGVRLSARIGAVGFLAREILDEAPAVITAAGGGA